MKSSRSSDRIATIIFRVMVGCVGVLIAASVFLGDFSWKYLAVVLPVGGLLLGYAFGGDRWGARLFNLFSISKIPEEEDESDSQV
ncbi:MAG: hypothetical protein ACSHYF_18225 [Verrucomicrobiaceae bacterium]